MIRGHRLAWAAAVAVLVAGAFLGATPSSGPAGGDPAPADDRPAASVLESSPATPMATAGRGRAGAEAELRSVLRFALGPLLAFVLVSLLGLVPRANAWWRLWRSDRWAGPPLRGATLAALRAPPALV